MARKFKASYGSEIADRLAVNALLESGAADFSAGAVKFDPARIYSIIDGQRDLVESAVSRIDFDCLSPGVIVSATVEGSFLAASIAAVLGLPVAFFDRESVKGAAVAGRNCLLLAPFGEDEWKPALAALVLADAGVSDVLVITAEDAAKLGAALGERKLALHQVLPFEAVRQAAAAR